MEGVRIERITSAAALERLRPAWRALWERAPGATPFQTPEWLLPWWRHFGSDELLTLAAWAGGELVALLPLYVLPEPEGRKLLMLGIGVSDVLDVLVLERYRMPAAAALLGAIAEDARAWDVCDLQPLPPRSPLIEAGPVPGLAFENGEQEPCPVLALPSSSDSLAHVLPRRMQQNVRYYRRRAGAAGALTVEAAGAGTFEELFAALVCLHEARWAARGKSGVLCDPRARAFHAEAAQSLLRAGMLRLYALRLDDRIVASLYGFSAKGRFFYYLGGFEPALAALGLGTLIVAHAIGEAVREGAREFDFLRGREAYKYRFGARDRAMFGLRLRPKPYADER